MSTDSQLDADRHRLLEQIDVHRMARRPIPCQSGDPYAAAAWTSDEDDEQLVAAAACRSMPCPALAACRAYGIAHPREEGAYGGMTQTQRRKAARDQRQAA